MPTAVELPPIAVYRDDGTWRWTCRVPSCCRSEWRGRHRDALGDAHAHLRGHRDFGFKGARRADRG